MGSNLWYTFGDGILSGLKELTHLPGQFLPNVTTLRSGICCHKSVCLSSVTFVRSTQSVEIFGDVSTPFSTVAIR